MYTRFDDFPEFAVPDHHLGTTGLRAAALYS